MNTLAALADHRFLALETYRRNGNPVVTPVWFVADDNRLYFSAPAHTGKVKRLRHTHQARIAPCDPRGRLLGEWLPVTTTRLDDTAATTIDHRLKQRYGWQRRMIDLVSWLRRWDHIIYAIDGSE